MGMGLCSDLPVVERCVVEQEVEGADDRVEDHLLLLQLDIHLQVEQQPGNLFDLTRKLWGQIVSFSVILEIQ